MPRTRPDDASCDAIVEHRAGRRRHRQGVRHRLAAVAVAHARHPVDLRVAGERAVRRPGRCRWRSWRRCSSSVVGAAAADRPRPVASSASCPCPPSCRPRRLGLSSAPPAGAPGRAARRVRVGAGAGRVSSTSPAPTRPAAAPARARWWSRRASCRPGRRGRIDGLDDSKLLTAATRERLYARSTRARAGVFGGDHPAAEIDAYGLHVANLAGMRRALGTLSPAAHYALTDGFPVGGLGVPSTAVWKGDADGGLHRRRVDPGQGDPGRGS